MKIVIRLTRLIINTMYYNESTDLFKTKTKMCIFEAHFNFLYACLNTNIRCFTKRYSSTKHNNKGTVEIIQKKYKN